MVPMGAARAESDWVDPSRPDQTVRVQVNAVTGDFFAVLGLPVRAGRVLSPADREGGVPVAVVSRATAATLWPGRNPLGQRLRTAGERASEYTVVGLVDDLVYSRQAGMQPTIYLSWEQLPRSEGILHLRTRPRVVGVERELAKAAAAAGVELFGVQTLAELRRQAAFPQRLTGVLLSVFGGVALLLATVGLYGVVSYGVSQRTHEIGVRIALGARAADVVRLIVGQGVRMAGIGLAAGVLLALALGRLLGSLLYGVDPADPLTFAGVATLLLLVAAGASWIPARRASRLEPTRALRAE